MKRNSRGFQLLSVLKLNKENEDHREDNDFISKPEPNVLQPIGINTDFRKEKESTNLTSTNPNNMRNHSPSLLSLQDLDVEISNTVAPEFQISKLDAYIPHLHEVSESQSEPKTLQPIDMNTDLRKEKESTNLASPHPNNMRNNSPSLLSLQDLGVEISNPVAPEFQISQLDAYIPHLHEVSESQSEPKTLQPIDMNTDLRKEKESTNLASPHPNNMRNNSPSLLSLQDLGVEISNPVAPEFQISQLDAYIPHLHEVSESQSEPNTLQPIDMNSDLRKEKESTNLASPHPNNMRNHSPSLLSLQDLGVQISSTIAPDFQMSQSGDTSAPRLHEAEGINVSVVMPSDTTLELNPETGLFECVNRSPNEIIASTSTSATQHCSQNDHTLKVKDKRQQNLVLRLHGKQYKGTKQVNGTLTLVDKPQRTMEEVPCTHGSINRSDRSYVCGTVNEQARKDVFKYFWSLSSWESKKSYVVGLVAVRGVLKRRKIPETNQKLPNSFQTDELSGSTRRKTGIDCYLPKENGFKVRVCRQFFLATLGIKKDTFTNWMQTIEIEKESNSEENQTESTKKKPLKSDSVTKWLEQLSKVPSHYCRASSSRIYVDNALESETKMHSAYIAWCKENSLSYVQRKKFCEILKDNKISIFKPRKDQCDTCLAYKEGNLEEEVYQAHIVKKTQARAAKTRIIASASDEHLVATMDLQSVQLCPKLLVSSQYCKQKLQMHVFTIYINNTKDVYLYICHEGDGGVTSNEFVSCIIAFIEEQLLKHAYTKITLISDGCAHQNRNKILASALSDISKMKNIEIEQLILEKGHTMMEVDSVHSTLENVFTPPIYSPSDYVNRCRKARTSHPYIINHIDYTFFSNYDMPSNFLSIRPGKKAGDPTVTDIRGLLYKHGEVFFKLLYEDEWVLLPQRRKADLYEPPPKLYKDPRKIEKSKYENLQSLKPYMHRDYHPFYDSLGYQ